MKLGVTSVVSAATVVAAIVTSAVGIDARYENRVQADVAHTLLAGERETGELEMELKLIDLELKQLRTVEQIRPLTREEQSRADYLVQRRLLIEARLLETLKTA